LSERLAKAISGSIVQNSARWRLVFEFSARKVGPTIIYRGQCEAVRLPEAEIFGNRDARL